MKYIVYKFKQTRLNSLLEENIMLIFQNCVKLQC